MILSVDDRRQGPRLLEAALTSIAVPQIQAQARLKRERWGYPDLRQVRLAHLGERDQRGFVPRDLAVHRALQVRQIVRNNAPLCRVAFTRATPTPDQQHDPTVSVTAEGHGDRLDDRRPVRHALTVPTLADSSGSRHPPRPNARAAAEADVASAHIVEAQSTWGYCRPSSCESRFKCFESSGDLEVSLGRGDREQRQERSRIAKVVAGDRYARLRAWSAAGLAAVPFWFLVDWVGVASRMRSSAGRIRLIRRSRMTVFQRGSSFFHPAA